MKAWNRDLVAGGSLILTGAWLSWYCFTHYSIGTLARMGPGMFPFGLGLILVALGGVVIAQAQIRTERLKAPKLRGPIFVLGSILLFGLIVEPFGIAPAIAALVLVSSLADGKVSWLSTIALCGILILFAYVIFDLILNLPLTFLDFPGP